MSTLEKFQAGDQVRINGSSYAFQITEIDGEYADARRVHPTTGQLEGGPAFGLFIGDGGAQMGIVTIDTEV